MVGKLRKFMLVGALLVLAAALVAQSAAAAPGKLDRSFGGGIVSVQPPLSKYDVWYPHQAAAGPNGRVYVLEESEACQPTSTPKCSSRITVSRYLKNGARDTSYGSAALTAGGPLPNSAPALAVDSQGRAIVAVQNGATGLAIARFSANGGLDTTFGQGGGLGLGCDTCAYDDVHVFVDRKGRVTLVAQQSDVKGAPTYEPGELQGALFIRLTASGAVDGSYGSGGQVFVPQLNLTEAIASRANGAIVSGAGKFLTLVSADGDTVDRDFAVALRLRNVREYEGIAAMAGGDLVVLGKRKGRSFLARLRPSGAVVRAFGKKGLSEFKKRSIWDVAVDDHDRTLAMGFEDDDPFLMRLGPKGHVESAFRDGLAKVGDFDGFAEAFYSGSHPMVFSQGATSCRAYCQPHPLLFRFLGGAGKRKHRK